MTVGKSDISGTTPSKEGTPNTAYDQMNTMAFLLEIHKDISAQSAKIERLITDRNEDNARRHLDSDRLDASIKALSDELTPVKASVDRTYYMMVGGFAVACVALAIIWFLVGDDIKALLAFSHKLPKP
ncbi:hypothetical protein [Mesorhizobium loti]|uniref:DUF1515 domain-containing protein n=1 Tax=Mesorhizobium loti R88b TaxID=935548 RepID=A0A6M7WHL6_RHILI|nr:hypothetical protein [Mesorhizobium loti]QKD01475.1 hypothetical protein EB235_08095 [Mesorhizobium loti R88b]